MSLPEIEALAREQAEYWDGEAGQKWADEHQRLDSLLRPLGLAAIDQLAPAPGEAVIDLGCGFGATALELGRRVTATGRVLGIDLSGPQLAVARESARAAQLDHVCFEHADVSTYDFAGSRHHAAFSRFGVMFFADPVAAFSTVRGALEPGGRLAFVCWQGIQHNEWVSVPLAATLPYLPPPTPPAPGAPGPFSLADPERIRDLLGRAGFREISVEAHAQTIRMGADAADAADWMTRMGPTARLLADVDDDTRRTVRAAIAAVLSDRQNDNGIVLDASTWIVRALA
ncbi:MAG TPA: class I SAM-dependent methyltransferase [Kofleriaceae bacterium]|nr:class I SAM-dependent methyltransferase [Kofleriaceae bacterium]